MQTGAGWSLWVSLKSDIGQSGEKTYMVGRQPTGLSLWKGLAPDLYGFAQYSLNARYGFLSAEADGAQTIKWISGACTCIVHVGSSTVVSSLSLGIPASSSSILGRLLGMD